MKRIIDGLRYDTDTAEELGSGGSAPGTSSTDFRWFEESLYRTKNGRYFLAGEGGPMTRYARSVGNNGTGGGEGLYPLSPDEAREWLEQYDCQEALERYFSPAEA